MEVGTRGLCVLSACRHAPCCPADTLIERHGRHDVSIAELERLLGRWSEDASFREAVRRDPEGAITGAGYDLDETEWATISETDWSLPDDDLRARMANVSASPPA